MLAAGCWLLLWSDSVLSVGTSSEGRYLKGFMMSCDPLGGTGVSGATEVPQAKSLIAIPPASIPVTLASGVPVHKPACPASQPLPWRDPILARKTMGGTAEGFVDNVSQAAMG